MGKGLFICSFLACNHYLDFSGLKAVTKETDLNCLRFVLLYVSKLYSSWKDACRFLRGGISTL